MNPLGGPHVIPGGAYAEERISLLLVGRRSDTDLGWLGGDAGEYGGETGENCEGGVLSTCEPGETAEPAVLAWLPNILSKRRRAPRCLPLPGLRAKEIGACGGVNKCRERTYTCLKTNSGGSNLQRYQLCAPSKQTPRKQIQTFRARIVIEDS